jgi:D-serine deaminase-like pyridoxal phosphate-dependent protein
MSAVIVDLDRLDQNIRQFHEVAAAAGCQVRAHVKAHRTIEIARRQVMAGAVGVAVHTAHAARRLAAAGVPDVVVAWPWPDPWRFDHYAQAAASVPRFAVHIDRASAITGIGAAAARRGTEIGVRLDLRHTPAAAVTDLAELAAHTAGVRFEGVTGYSAPATSQEIHDRYEHGRRYAQRVVDAAEAIRASGVDCPVVSVGGTPTAGGASTVAGVTEICAGAYATYDGGLADAGVCGHDQVALSVAADAAGLLAGCAQPWAPEVTSLPAAPPYHGRLAPAHICPLASALVRGEVAITVVASGQPAQTWRPFAAPDRE